MNTKPIIPIILIGIMMAFISCNSINRLYVPMGDSKINQEKSEDGITRIYIDRQGNLYPATYVSNNLVKYGLLQQAYQDKNLLKQVCMTEGVNVSSGDELPQIMENLEDKLIDKMVREVNLKSAGKDLIFLIHGFNDHPEKPSGNSAIAEYENVMNIINEKYPARKFHFVQVYWDGLSGENGSAMLKAFNAIKIWNNSQVSATYAGLELRRILSGINAKKYFVITHSHGAGVITNALFNVRKFNEDYYTNEGKFIVDKYNSIKYSTPTQEVYVGMLAPAIPGINVFDEYYYRTISGTNQFDKSAKNYHFVNGFDHYDMVTRKFYIMSSKLGASTLACKYDELDKTMSLIGDSTLFNYTNFSKYDGKPQRSHSWFKYMSNKPPIDNFLQNVLNN